MYEVGFLEEKKKDVVIYSFLLAILSGVITTFYMDLCIDIFIYNRFFK